MGNEKLYQELGFVPELNTTSEIQCLDSMIAESKLLTGAEIDVIYAAFSNGPLDDGDVPSKSGRTSLVNRGLMARVIVKGQYGYNALTYQGAVMYRILKADQKLRGESHE